MRTYKKDSTGVRKYFFDGGVRVLMEFNKKGKIRARYTLGPGIDEIISEVRDQGSATEGGPEPERGETRYYHYDGLGSVTELTDESGEVVERLRYKPFGQLKEGGGSNSFAFTGREYDKDSGLYYYRSRYYNGVTGRFLSRDPIGLLGGNNLYLYVGNNPVNWVDPWGFGKEKRKSLWQAQRPVPTDKLSLSDIIHRFKTLTTKKYIDGVKNDNWKPFHKHLWQRSFHDHIIRNDKSLNNIREYIINNPLKWADDENNINNYKVTGQACLTPTGQF